MSKTLKQILSTEEIQMAAKVSIGSEVQWEMRIKTPPLQDFPSSPEMKTPSFQSRGHRFDPWWGN